ncbi:MAG: hypothetical protein J0H67_17460 [Rhodospirillales bacterium]|nr:hypothetical protein [Rhodospirillales bacterium]
MAAEILSLAQQSRPVRPSVTTVDPDDTERFPEVEQHRLLPIRGVVFGIGLSLPVWVAIAAIVYFVL